MRANEFIIENTDITPSSGYTNIATAISLLQNHINQAGLSPKISTNLLIKLIQNTGIDNFDYASLLDANDNEPAVKNLIKNITPETVTLVSTTDTDSEVVNNPDTSTPVSPNPEAIVGNMAKSALKRRQD